MSLVIFTGTAKFSSQTTTIIQFRAMDFGMEECSLMLHLPNPRGYSGSNDTLAISDTPQLQICRLDTTRFLDTKTVTWASRPRCSEPQTRFTAVVGKEYEILSHFPCPWGTYHSFEVTCAGSEGESVDDCLVDVWSNHNHTWG